IRLGLFPAGAMIVGAAISRGIASIVASNLQPRERYTDVVKKICDTILDAIGETPMVRINSITKALVTADVVAKIETITPDNSIKDRMAVRMIEDAERAG